MKPFNLEEAKAGKPVCTRDGRKARIICFDYIDYNYRIISLVYEEDGEHENILNHSIEGNYVNNEESESDLFMVSEKKKLWIAINPNKETINGLDITYHSTRAFESFYQISVYIQWSNFKDYKIIEIEMEL